MFIALFSGILAYLATVFLVPVFIRFYRRHRLVGQQMHEDVKQHQAKKGTPTMGGLVFLLVSSCLGLLVGWMTHQLGYRLLLLLGIFLIYGLIGWIDDWMKISRQINEGLTPKQKLLFQLIAGGGFSWLYLLKGESTDLNFFGFSISLGIIYVGFILFWFVGFSNAVNLTDGIDGLASISVVISLVAYAVISLQQGASDLFLVCLSVIGSLIGFFHYNHSPAKIFMGDVGSISLGALLAAMSIFLHQEWTLLFIGSVYVIETTSVLIQVSYFKYTKRKEKEGKRLFRMTPYHHHLELGGPSLTKKNTTPWNEWQVDFFLWGIGLVSAVMILFILYC